MRTTLFNRADDVKRAELELGALSADGRLELLDGVVVDWPAKADRPCWRAVRNVPRLGALTEAAWDRQLIWLAIGAPTVAGRLHLGAHAIVLVVSQPYAMLLSKQLPGADLASTPVWLDLAEYRLLCRQP